MKAETVLTQEETLLLKEELLKYVTHVLHNGGGKDDEGIFSAALTALLKDFLGKQ